MASSGMWYSKYSSIGNGTSTSNGSTVAPTPKTHIDFYDAKVEAYKSQDFETIKRDCLAQRRLFEDPLFPCNDQAISYSKSVPAGVTWKRPGEIVRWPLQPIFIYNEAHAYDLDQGNLGNCWFIAACSAITFVPEVFHKVVPKDQICSGRYYAGVFHFRFWLYGKWYDVVVDDRLPVFPDGKLAFCSNKQEPNEFWAALLEKAYAKIHLSYENLDGGQTRDALIDMSGGIEESFSLREMLSEKHKELMWDILIKARKLKTLMGASITPNPHVLEARLYNGLVMGHAYCISRVACVEINGKNVRLIRVLNPWGNEIEWKGGWSDNSKEWDEVSEELREALEHKNLPNGEFWMSYEDFYRNFHTVEFCNLTPDAYSTEHNKPENSQLVWNLVAYHSEWVPGSTAGGCGQYNEALYWTNPQFLVTLTDPDLNDTENLATMIISLMQKHTRENRSKQLGQVTEEFIQFRIYRIKKDEDADSAKNKGLRLYAGQLERIGVSGKYINSREVTKRFRVEPGNYLIVPSCYDANRKGDFLLRIFTERPINDLNCKILDDHKDIVTYNDLFFFNKNSDEIFSSWASLLGSKNSNDEANQTADDKAEAADVTKVSVQSQFKPINTPVFETFEKVVQPKKQGNGGGNPRNCTLM